MLLRELLSGRGQLEVQSARIQEIIETGAPAGSLRIAIYQYGEIKASRRLEGRYLT